MLWSYDTSYYSIDASAAVVNGIVYFADDSYDGSDVGTVFALNAKTGSLLWFYNTANAVSSSPAVANGVLYIGSTDQNIYALNAATGAFLWKYTTGGFIGSSPAVANGTVYVGSYDTYMYAFDKSSGTSSVQAPGRH
jgi:outer membrane protein assembly factor BamB